jgi:hypothetical protein
MIVICVNKLVLFRSSMCTVTLLLWLEVLSEVILPYLESICGEILGQIFFSLKLTKQCYMINLSDLKFLIWLCQSAICVDQVRSNNAFGPKIQDLKGPRGLF